MKKITLLTVVALLFTTFGCSKSGATVDEGIVSISSSETDVSITDVVYETGVYDYSKWEIEWGVYNYDVIPDAETAVKVAMQIYSSMEDGYSNKSYVPQHVFFDESKQVWIVSFWNKNDISLGGDYSIAIQKSDGKVLRIWLND